MSSVYLSASCQEKNIGVDGISEEERLQQLARNVAAFLRPVGITVFLNKPEWSLSQIVADSNARKPDLHIALHSNAGGGSGTETWCYGITDTDSAKFGRRLQAALHGILGLPDRGTRDVSTPGHRWAEVIQTNATAVLTEIFFHDNQEDIQRFIERRQAVTEAIAEVICNWFGVCLHPQPAPVPTVGFAPVEVHVVGQVIDGLMINGRVYASVRALAEALGHAVGLPDRDWDGKAVWVE